MPRSIDDRILRGTGPDGFYSTKKLGAIGADLGAVACFFTTPWTTLAPSLAPADQAWLLNEAAFNLRALGRLTEAAEPMRAGLAMGSKQGDWKNAAIGASNLSELELTRGEVAAAVAAGEQAVTYADRSGDAFQQMVNRTTQADALHQAGRRAEARGLFEDAEARQAAGQPEYPRLYSLRGFRYCDLLLAEAERAAWQRWLRGEAGLGETLAAAVAGCEAVGERAAQTLEWRDIAELRSSTSPWTTSPWPEPRCTRPTSRPHIPAPAHQHITAAVDGLRAAGADELSPPWPADPRLAALPFRRRGGWAGGPGGGLGDCRAGADAAVSGGCSAHAGAAVSGPGASGGGAAVD